MKKILNLCACILISGLASAQINLNLGLEVCLPMNGNANDMSGNGNNGIVMGATLVSDRFSMPNSAYSFNGSSDYIYLPSSTSLSNIESNNELTITAWCKVNAWYSNWNVFPIINKYNTGTDWGYDYTLQAPVGCSEQLFVPNAPIMSNYCLLQASGTTTFGQWDFYAITYSKSANQFSAYKNGVLVYTNNVANMPIETTGSGNLYIGFSPASPAADEYADGSIDDLRMYSRALNPAEISALYSGATCGQDPLGIKSIQTTDNELSVSPNPANEKLCVRLNNNDSNAAIKITDMPGKEITVDVMLINTNTYEINTSGLNEGIYFVSIRTDKGMTSRKFVKVN
jgi:hypothetical protein